ncbi:MAG: hypothetical protein E5X80_18275 [Mesorhizobium sp.]|nr:MAG: hypothetical protein EOR71_04915 [Mesorhizobium sp.]TIO50681.1 MAG: hypothetical protein E5X78_20745 [Mesorhizobium sp.]TIO60299.1 MAG: hypothetical protein E5X79_13210 [Mesorhizobium sp.]TJV62651.1 MAG: hypothetical protein E5X80_18275 [Mesorhizobium sp.]
MTVAIVLRLLGLVQPFVFQTIIDRVLPFQREATLVLIVVVLVLATLFSACLGALSAYLGNHMANRLIAELARRIFDHVLNLRLRYPSACGEEKSRRKRQTNPDLAKSSAGACPFSPFFTGRGPQADG